MTRTAQMKQAIASRKTEPKKVQTPKVTHKELPGGGPATIIQHETGTACDNLPDVQPKKPKKQKEPAIDRGPAPARDKAHETKGRLPDGSAFAVKWDAKSQRWSGTLTIMGEGVILKEFSDYSAGVFRLLANLDNRYRAWLAKETVVASSQPC